MWQPVRVAWLAAPRTVSPDVSPSLRSYGAHSGFDCPSGAKQTGTQHWFCQTAKKSSDAVYVWGKVSEPINAEFYILDIMTYQNVVSSTKMGVRYSRRTLTQAFCFDLGGGSTQVRLCRLSLLRRILCVHCDRRAFHRASQLRTRRPPAPPCQRCPSTTLR